MPKCLLEHIVFFVDSVAKDLGFEENELTEMLKLPDDAFDRILCEGEAGKFDYCIFSLINQL